MTLEITLVVLLALLNGFFALSEMALMVVAQEPPQAPRDDEPARQGRASALRRSPSICSRPCRCSSRCCRLGAGAALGATHRRADRHCARRTRPAVDRQVQRADRRRAERRGHHVRPDAARRAAAQARRAASIPNASRCATALPMRVLTWLAIAVRVRADLRSRAAPAPVPRMNKRDRRARQRRRNPPARRRRRRSGRHRHRRAQHGQPRAAPRRSHRRQRDDAAHAHRLARCVGDRSTTT